MDAHRGVPIPLGEVSQTGKDDPDLLSTHNPRDRERTRGDGKPTGARALTGRDSYIAQATVWL
jgi:hypothetical protein